MPRLATETASFTDETSVAAGLLGLLESPEWHKRARCKASGVDFFPDREKGAKGAQAKSVCASCPALTPCLAFALAQDDKLVGIWGGTTTGERRLLRAAHKTAA